MTTGFENTTLTNTYLYNQYASLDWLKQFFKLIDNTIQDDFIGELDTYITAIDIKNSYSKFLTFYTRYYLGLNRPLGGSSIANYYDTGELYDNKELIYDDAESADGLITEEQYLQFIKFIYDYSIECLNIIDIIQFVADFCGIEASDISVDYSSRRTIVIYLPQTDECIEFIKIALLEYSNMALPFGDNILDFKINYDEETE